MDKASRSFAAAIIAPATPSALTVIIPVILSGSWPFHYELPMLISASLLVSYLAFFAVGLPAIGWLRRRNALSWGTLVFAGGAAGGLFGFLALAGLGLILGTLKYSPLSAMLAAAGCGAGYGAATSCVYGLIAGWPNNSSKPTPLRGAA